MAHGRGSLASTRCDTSLHVRHKSRRLTQAPSGGTQASPIAPADRRHSIRRADVRCDKFYDNVRDLQEGSIVAQNLVIFDTSALPEYYDDVHKILALPNKHIVTYDYGEGHVSAAAIEVLRKKKTAPQNGVRAVLAYIQPWAYKKGAGLTDTNPLAEPTFQALTRLANIVEVREVTNNNKARFYVDLELLGYSSNYDDLFSECFVCLGRVDHERGCYCADCRLDCADRLSHSLRGCWRPSQPLCVLLME
jgi:hypothetical protein